MAPSLLHALRREQLHISSPPYSWHGSISPPHPRAGTTPSLLPDWDVSVDDRKITNVIYFFWGNISILWLSKNNNYMSLSTTEGKYIVMRSFCTQLMLRKQISADYVMDSRSFTVYCNNKSAINISKNQVQP